MMEDETKATIIKEEVDENEFSHQVVWKSESLDNFYYEGSDAEEEEEECDLQMDVDRSISEIRVKQEQEEYVDVDITTYYQCRHCSQNFLSLQKLEEHIEDCECHEGGPKVQRQLPTTLAEKLQTHRNRLLESLESQGDSNSRNVSSTNNNNNLPNQTSIIIDTTIISEKLKNYKSRLVSSLVKSGHRDPKTLKYPKPKITYPSLATLAIRNSSSGKLSVPQIWNFLCTHFPYFKTVGKQVRNGTTSCNTGLRNALTKTVNSGFIKWQIPNPGKPPSFLWSLDPKSTDQMDDALQCDLNEDPEDIKLCMANPKIFEALRDYKLKDREDTDAGKITEQFSSPNVVSTNSQHRKIATVNVQL